MQRTFSIVGVSILFLLIIFAGCSSDEEKLASHLSKGKKYLEKEEYKAAEIEKSF